MAGPTALEGAGQRREATLVDAPGVDALGAAEDVNDGLARLIADLRPDVLLFDASGDAPDEDSLSLLLPMLAQDGPPLVVLTDRPEREVPGAAQAGARNGHCTIDRSGRSYYYTGVCIAPDCTSGYSSVCSGPAPRGTGHRCGAMVHRQCSF